ncbi:hypothetical protein C5167_047391 [Papaver somniferum]|uniref:MER3 helicase-like winged helix domain-containing protein n=1 Tax=Papaver somniferum TaxID=3469 RepID=A0A4Y7LIS7_PAPSO|nr:hypothetical protein C5167_047391 [Papaver somniferum]
MIPEAKSRKVMQEYIVVLVMESISIKTGMIWRRFLAKRVLQTYTPRVCLEKDALVNIEKQIDGKLSGCIRSVCISHASTSVIGASTGVIGVHEGIYFVISCPLYYLKRCRTFQLFFRYVCLQEKPTVSHDKVVYYLRLSTSQLPIESQFISSLKDNLNAEVALGTVTNVKEACAWLGYTYLFIRMKSNPSEYGIGWDEVMEDPSLISKQRSLVTDAACSLDKSKMMRLDKNSGNFLLYRTSSHCNFASHFKKSGN